MEILSDIESHYKHLIKVANSNPKSVFIGTYGIYAGITMDGRDSTEWGDKYHLYTREFLDIANTLPDVRALIGVPDYKSCKRDGPCEDCEIGYVAQIIRIYNHILHFSNIKWRWSEASHFKGVFMVFDDGIKGVIGGRNLNDSSWFDMSYAIEGSLCIELFKKSLTYYKECHIINEESINILLARKGIRESSIARILNV